MRLVCPNCGAQYEVDDRVIPDSGRDVQCSSCGHAWYQMPAHMDAEEEPPLTEPDGAEVADADEDPGLEPEPEVEPEVVPELGREPEPELEQILEQQIREGRPPASETLDQSASETLDEPASETLDEPASETLDEPASETLDEKVSAAVDAALGFETEALAEDAPDTVPDAAPDTVPDTAAPAVESDTAPAVDRYAADEGEDDVAPPPSGIAGMATPRRELDQNLRAILQEEVAREMQARAAKDEPRPAAAVPGFVPAAAPSPAKPKGAPGLIDETLAGRDDETTDSGPVDTDEPAADTLDAVQAKAPRRDLFPDIEEINSTLDSHAPADEGSYDEEPEARGGFSRGFFAVIFIAALALAMYLVAPRLAETIPALEPALTAYVGAVNGARETLEGLLQRMTDSIDSSE